VSKKHYEYKFTEGAKPGEVITEIEPLGRSDWELVSVVFDTKEAKYVAFLKKKVRLGKKHERDSHDTDLE
jgi:hypothetical protein